MIVQTLALSVCAIAGWESSRAFFKMLDQRTHPYDEAVVCGDERGQVYVNCDYNPDDIRMFYEIPEVMAEIVRDQDPDATFVEALSKLVHPYGEEGL